MSQESSHCQPVLPSPDDSTSWIADAGSTKTDWTCLWGDGQSLTLQTSGINPFMQESKSIAAMLGMEFRGFSLRLPVVLRTAARVTFYGAGCRGSGVVTMREALGAVFENAEIEVFSDLTGAARALCQDTDGIACILGTGSNSGLYVGGEIKQNTPPLGFILGDEGSGASLGKQILGNYLKGLLPGELADAMREYIKMDVDDIIHRVYRTPYPNRFLASLAPFLHRHRNLPLVHELIVDEMKRFIRRNIQAYRRPDLPLCATGGIAFHFQEEFKEAARWCHFTTGTIALAPMEGLTAWHRAHR